MDILQLELENGAGPADTKSWLSDQPLGIHGSWRLSARPDYVEVRLVWYTEGKGDRDVRIVRSERIESARQDGTHHWQWPLPEAPYSFSGK